MADPADGPPAPVEPQEDGPAAAAAVAAVLALGGEGADPARRQLEVLRLADPAERGPAGRQRLVGACRAVPGLLVVGDDVLHVLVVEGDVFGV